MGVGETAGGAGAGGGGARSAVVQLAVLGLIVALIGLGALIVWTVLRWLRMRMEARESASAKHRRKDGPTTSAWAESAQRIGGGTPATPWPSIANPNLRDPVARMLEREHEDDDVDDNLEETRPMNSDPALDDTDGAESGADELHDTDEEHRWEFESGGHEPDSAADDDGDDKDDEEDTGFGDDSMGFDGDDTDELDDTDDPDRRGRW